MAKLSAYGQKEVSRFSREREVNHPSYPGDKNPVVWRRITYALMSNGRVLKKEDARWADGMRHTWGWNVALRANGGRDLDAIEAQLISKGYEREAA